MRPGPAGRNPERSRLWAARNTSAFRRAPRVPFRTDEKEPKVRLRGLHLGRPARAAPGARYARRPLAGAPPRDPGLSPLRGPGPTSRNSKRNLREYLASTRRLPPLPTGTQAVGTIQVAGAPPRDPGLRPLRGPGPAGRNSKRYLREYLAMTRRLQPLPTGTPAEGSIQVAGAPNYGTTRLAKSP